MKLLLTSDWHLDAVTAGVPRLYEIGPFVDELIKTVEKESIDYVIHLGDVFDPGRMMGPHLAAILIEVAAQVTEAAGTGSLWIAGNHDVIESSVGATTLSPLAAACRICDGDLSCARVSERPETILLGIGSDGPGLAALCLPYVARAVENSPGFAEVKAAAFAKARALQAEGLPLAVFGHLTVPGAILGSETREMPRGRDLDFPAEEVAALVPVLVSNGHYHRSQTVEVGKLSIVIPGSPHRFTFGERNDERKGFTVVEVQGA